MTSFFLFILSVILSNFFNTCPVSDCNPGDLCSLSLEQKVGQLFMVGIDGTTVDEKTEAMIKEIHPGGVLLLGKNIQSEDQLKKMTSDLQSIALKDSNLPLFIAVDQEGGQINRIGFLQENTPEKDIDDKDEAYQVGLKRGQELKQLGINLNLSPLLDSASQGDFIFDRTFQKDESQAAQLAQGLIEGQKAAGILSCIKHFPGYTGASFNPEDDLYDRNSLPEIGQFKEAMESSPEFVMTSNVVYENLGDLPFPFLRSGIDFLKDQLGDTPLVLTDDLDQYSLLNNYSLEDVITKPLNAGVDMMIFSGWRLPSEQGVSTLLSAVKDGKVSQEVIDRAVERIIEIKQKIK